MHDALTGLPNRVLLLERLKHAFLRGGRSGKKVGLLFIDLDRFKMVNDTHGHRIGDELLVAVGKRLGALLRPEDTLARLSGDEFVVLCEDLDSADQADAIAARLRAAFDRSFLLLGVKVDMTASIGIAVAGRDHHAPDELLHQADTAMYQAKRQGGAGRQVLDMTAAHLEEHEAGLEVDLRRALERGQMSTVYQPIVAAVDGRITGVEALVRWSHPTRGMVAPSILIPLAEHSGLIAELGYWVLSRAWADRQDWQDHGQGVDLAMSVNVSAQQLMSPGFVDTVAAVLYTAETDPGRLTLEVTESLFVRDSERALVVLKDLKAIGVMLALDDFGTGYSSLSYLRRFPIDIVKVDQSFAADLGHDPASSVIVDAIVHLAHGLGMAVVGEGVETAEQHHELTGLGCDSCQGFYFARPMAATKLDTLIQPSLDGTTRRLPVLTATRE